MQRLVLFIAILFHAASLCLSQNISGTINSYAAVTNISGNSITVSSTTGFSAGDRLLLIQMKGATVSTANSASFGNINSYGGAGIYEFLDVISVAGGALTTSAIINTYNFSSGFVQVVRVPKYCQTTVTSTLTCPAWSASVGYGGIIALEAGTITLNSDINANAMGFKGGSFANSNFCCSNGNYSGAAGGNGGQKGESISAYIIGSDGLKGKQANGGGASNCDNSGGGGGGNGGAGGIGGNQYSGCGSFDDRGIGGLNLTNSFATLFMGGGGGGGFSDNFQPCTPGGNGGGIIYIKANLIVSNTRTITANGGSVTTIINDEGAGGGGAGGTIFIECNSITGTLKVSVDGGEGGSNNNSLFPTDSHGPGGGGGGGYFALSPAALPGGVTFSGLGGAAGTVNNPSSPAAGTTYGAGPGTNGSWQGSLPTIPQAFNTPTLIVAQSNTICTGQSMTLSATGATTYSWSTGATTSSIAVSPSANTQYTLQGFNGSCWASIISTVNLVAGPSLTVAGIDTLCAGTSVTATVSGASSYTWSTGSHAAIVTLAPSGPGTTSYNVTGNSGGCSSAVTHTVFVIPMPTVSISGNSGLCQGESTTLTASFANSITWNTGATTSVIVVSPVTSTTYSVTGANGSCTVSAVKSITVSPSPTITISASSPSLCSGGSSQLSGSGAVTYSWSTGSTNSVITVTPLSTSVYTLYGTTSGCSSPALVTITVIPTPTLSASNQSLCIGQNQAVLAASGAASYIWSPNLYLSSNNSAVVAANPPNTMTYVLQGSNASCTSSIQVVVQTYTPPNVSISSSADVICKGNFVRLSGSGADAYSWQPATQFSNSASYSVMVKPDTTTVYTLFGYASGGCPGMVTKTIVVLPNPQTRVGSESYVICAGGQVTLEATGAPNYSWTPPVGLSSNNQNIVIAAPLASQHYTVTGYTGVFPHTCASQATLVVDVLPIALLKITGPDSVCYAQRANLLASGGKSYTWTPALFLSNAFISNPVVRPTEAIIYTVTGVGANTCPGTTTFSIAIKPVPSAYAGRDTVLNFDQFTILHGQGDGRTYTWKGIDLSGLNCINCPDTYIQPQRSACYILEVENEYGCRAQDEVCVEVTHDHALYIPNSFSPNGDGINDVFMPQGFGVIKYSLSIYDRWGEKLFEGNGSFTDGPVISWDGNYKGRRCKTDSYVYMFVYTLTGSKQQSKEGTVLLLGPKD